MLLSNNNNSCDANLRFCTTAELRLMLDLVFAITDGRLLLSIGFARKVVGILSS